MNDPFAVTSSGAVLLNIQNFDGVETSDDGLRRALREGTPVFIGVAMTAREIRDVLKQMRDVMHESSWLVIGQRQRRGR